MKRNPEEKKSKGENALPLNFSKIGNFLSIRGHFCLGQKVRVECPNYTLESIYNSKL